MDKGYIYKITSPNNKIYIGQTISLNKRKCKYKNLNCKKQPKIYNSIKKYGWDNHVFEILQEIENLDILNNIEDYWIFFYDSIDNGLNCTYNGNDNCRKKVSIETRKKMSESAMGNINSKGHKVSENVKKIISNTNKGNTTRRGKKMSKETLLIMKKNSEGNTYRKGKKSSEKTRILSSFNRTKPENNLPILVYDKAMNFVCEYKNKMEASLDLNKQGKKVTTSAIWQVCTGRKKSYLGYVFKFKNQEL